MKFKKSVLTALAVPALVLGGLVASAAPANAASCGYYEEPAGFYYNHCAASGRVKIQIDYIIGNTTKCVDPGVTLLQWRSDNPFTNPTNAFYIGGC